MVAGGGEMNRVTSSVASMTNNARASLVRRSRYVTSDPVSVGRPCRQSLAISDDGSRSGTVEATVSSLLGHLLHQKASSWHHGERSTE
jgi:hypothetical protein